MRRAVLTSARLHRDSLPSGFRAAMITCTYRPGVRWDRHHISELIRKARQWLRRRGHRMRYVWVLELTKAGVPHYHLMLWLPRRVRLPKPDKAGWWPHGFSRIEWARKAVGYLAKYASKGTQGAELPRGARIHGAGGLAEPARLERAWWLSPAYVRERCTPADRPVRAEGGGWLLRATGEWFASVWRIVDRGKGWVLLERIEEGA